MQGSFSIQIKIGINIAQMITCWTHSCDQVPVYLRKKSSKFSRKPKGFCSTDSNLA